MVLSPLVPFLLKYCEVCGKEVRVYENERLRRCDECDKDSRMLERILGKPKKKKGKKK